MEEKRSTFYGTYFNKGTILRLARLAKIFSWVVLGIYAAQFTLQVLANLVAIARGYWVGMAIMDAGLNFLFLLESPLRGGVYFVLLQAFAQVLLVLLDVEDNTRRAARQKPDGTPAGLA